MTTLQHVHQALAALAPPGVTIYDDQAPQDAVAPWIVVGLQVPAAMRSETGTHAGIATWQVTVCALTGAQARVFAGDCEAAWTGARLSLPGYRLGALQPGEPVGPYAAGMTVFDTNLKYQVVRLPFTVTLARTPLASPPAGGDDAGSAGVTTDIKE